MDEGADDDAIIIEKHPERGSTALLDYYWAVEADFRLFNLVIDSITSGDYVTRLAKDALDGRDDYRDLTPGELAETDPGPRTQALRESQQELLEMFLSRIVDNFQVYVVDLIRAVLHERPEILKSRQEQVSVEYALGFDSVDDLVHDLIETKVNNLTYKGFDDLQDWCSSRGIPLLVPDAQTDRIVSLVALRNLIVHNRCKVDTKYLKTVPDTDLEIGDVVRIAVDDFFQDLNLLNTIVNTTDVATCGKFGLSREEVSSELQARRKERFIQNEEEGVGEGTQED